MNCIDGLKGFIMKNDDLFKCMHNHLGIEIFSPQ